MSSSSIAAGRALTFDPTNFNPENQTLTIFLPDGTPIHFTTLDVNEFYSYAVGTVINYGAQLGASLIILLLLAVLTKPDKRHSPILIINCVSLLFNLLRLLLNCLYFNGPLNDTYAFFSGDYSQVSSSAYRVSEASVIFSFLLVILIEVSLALQVQVVCITLKTIYRRALFGLSFVVGTFAIGFRLSLCVENVKSIITLEPSEDLIWLQGASLNATAASIFWFCAVFVTKLGLALNQRSKLGLRKFGPMKVIFIMGCQTLFVPAFFAILQYCPTGIPNMDSNVLTTVAIFLPLSSIWAASTLSGSSSAAPIMQQKAFSAGSSTTRNNSNAPFFMTKQQFSPTSSAFTNTTVVEASPMRNAFSSPSIDLERNNGGVMVERSFQVSEK